MTEQDKTIRQCAEVLVDYLGAPCVHIECTSKVINCRNVSCNEREISVCWEQFLTAKIREKEKN